MKDFQQTDKYNKFMEKLKKVKSLQELREQAELEAFTTLPLKAHGVDFDILERFRAEGKNFDVVGGTMKLPFMTIQDSQMETNKLEVIEKEKFEKFSTFLKNTSVVDRGSGKYFRIIQCCAPFLDPFARLNKVVTPVVTYLNIFTVSGTEGILAPYWPEDYFTNIPEVVMFRWMPPSHEVVVEGAKILGGG